MLTSKEIQFDSQARLDFISKYQDKFSSSTLPQANHKIFYNNF